MVDLKLFYVKREYLDLDWWLKGESKALFLDV
jgi:hypothetical protein